MPSKTFKKKDNWLVKNFGDKVFVSCYWKIAFPAFLWAIFISLSPIFATVIITSVIPKNTFGNNNATLSNIYNYNIFGFSYIDILSVVFIIAGFSIIGNLIAKKDLIKLNEIMKDILYFSLIISIIITIFMTIYSQEFEKNLFGFSQSYLTYGSTFMSWSAISIIFYMLTWYFISSFSSLNLIWIQCFSAIVSFIFYLIVLSSYSFCLSINETKKETISIVRNYAIIYDFWYLVQIIIVFGYCYLPNIYKIKKINNKLAIIKEENIAYNYFYFLRKINWKIDWKLVAFYFIYSYWIMLDVAIWAIADIFSQIGGVIDPHAGLNASNQKIYHQVILLCTQYSIYLYIFFNGFGLITNQFLSIPLANQEIDLAKKNTKRLFWWGFIIALSLLFFVLIISYELNMYLIGGINNPHKYWYYQTTIDNKYETTMFTYQQLWNMGMGMSCIYGVYMFINIIFNNIYYFEVSGNSRWIWFSDAFVSVIYAILTWSLILTHNNLNNLFAWYALNKSYVLFKLFFGLIIVLTKKTLNSIDKPNWIFNNKKLDLLKNKLFDNTKNKALVKE